MASRVGFPLQEHTMSKLEPQTQSGVRPAIEAASRRWKSAFDARDVEAATRLYHDDAVLLPPDGDAIEGAAGIRGFIEAYLEILIAKEDLRTTEVEPLGDGAFEVGTYRGRHRIEGQTIPDRGKYLRIWKQDDDGNWKIYREMFNDSPIEG
jgi:uncharacterized protein (TIGR02246 family)